MRSYEQSARDPTYGLIGSHLWNMQPDEFEGTVATSAHKLKSMYFVLMFNIALNLIK